MGDVQHSFDARQDTPVTRTRLKRDPSRPTRRVKDELRYRSEVVDSDFYHSWDDVQQDHVFTS